jgi:hypothetical protein
MPCFLAAPRVGRVSWDPLCLATPDVSGKTQISLDARRSQTRCQRPCLIFLIYEPLAEDRSAQLLNHFTLQGLAFQLKPAGFPGRRFKVRNSPDARISSDMMA